MKGSNLSLQEVDHESHLKVLKASLNNFPDERVDMLSKYIACQECGITYDLVPISVVGLCKHCLQIHQYDNY